VLDLKYVFSKNQGETTIEFFSSQTRLQATRLLLYHCHLVFKL